MAAIGEAESFGVVLRRSRSAAGLSQHDLAERAGLSRRGISDLERGTRRSPYPETVRRLADALGLRDGERAALLAAGTRAARVRTSRTDAGEQAPPSLNETPGPRTIDSSAHLVGLERVASSAPDGRSTADIKQPRICPVLIGRDGELAALEHWLDRTRSGTGQTVLIAGDPGIGKSRLVATVKQQAEQLGFRILEGHCFEPDRALPYAPVVDLLRNWLDQHSAVEVATSITPELAAPMGDLLPELASVLGTMAPLPLDPEQQKRRLFHSLEGWLATLTQHSPVLLVVEDLHWADASSLEFLLHAARRLAARKILMLLTFRSDEVQAGLRQTLAEFDRQRLTVEVSLAPLGRAQVDAMLRAILAADRPIRTEFLDTIQALTEGNPFFVEEVIGGLLANGDVSSSAAGWGWRPVGGMPLPRTVQDAVHRRVDCLRPGARRAVELAAVSGRRFDFGLLVALTEQPEPEIIEHIKELVGAQLVVEEAPDRFAFRHALTREAIYTGLLGHERRLLHGRVAQALERRSVEPSDSGIAALAYHTYQAGAWESALAYAQRAGERALAVQAPAAAAELFSWALDAAVQLGIDAAAALWHARGRAYEMLGDFERARADLEAALMAARSTRNEAAEWQTLLDLGFLWAARDLDRTGEYHRQALAVARQIADPAIFARSLNRIGNWHLNLEQLAEARRYHAQALTIFERLNDPRGLAETHDLLGMTSYIQGDLLQAALHYGRASALFKELGDRRGIGGTAELLMACAGSLLCDTLVVVPMSNADAVGAGELALRLAHEMGWRAGQADAHVLLGYYLGFRGEYGAALEHARAALDIAEEVEHRPWMTSAQALLGLLHLDLSALVQARWHLERALELAREMGSRVWICAAAGFLAWACVEQRELTRAERVLDDALGDAPGLETVGQRNCWVGRAELDLARGEYARALDVIDRLIVSAANAAPECPIPRLEHLRAQALAGLGRHAEAVHAWELARTAAAEWGARPLLWRIHARRGAFHASRGRPAEAAREYAAAWSLVDELAADVPDDRLRATFREHVQASVPRPKAAFSAPADGHPRPAGLSPREAEIVNLVAAGRTNREIADELVLSIRTVERHLANIYTKLSLSGRAARAAAAAHGATHGMATPTLQTGGLT